MTLRTRVTIAAGSAVLVAVIAVSALVYLVVRANLRDQIYDSLRSHEGAQLHDLSSLDDAATRIPFADDIFVQVVDRDGNVVLASDQRQLPLTDDVLAVARGERTEAWFDTDVDGTPVRVNVTSPQPGVAVQVGRSLAEVHETLRQLLLALAVISAAAVALAALIGRLVAAAASAPVHRVADAAQAVARTGDLAHHLDVPGGDDLGRLAASFNTMLDALEESLTRQRQLVADASHELRTPLATVRTNVEVLARADELPTGERDLLIRDAIAQIGELTRLVEDLVELARGDGTEEPFEPIDLGSVTGDVVDSLRRSHPTTTFEVDTSRTMILGAPGRVARAVSNLVDNAAKWTPAGQTVHVSVRDATVTVRDHGPGIETKDLPHIFDRFYRAAGARALPGSGLGLAIVKQVADSHGGTVTATNADGRGACFALQFPASTGPTPGTSEIPTERSRSS